MRKKLISLALALVLCLGLLPAADAAEKTVSIYTPEDLVEFGERVSDEPNLSAVLMADLDLSGVEALPLGMKTVILGPNLGVRREIGYSGTFDGNGHTISNPNALLLVNLSPGGVVRNLNITDGYCIAEYNCGLIENCTVSGTTAGVSHSMYSGGISCTNGKGFYTESGWVSGPGTIRNCRASQTISIQLPDADSQAYANIGGIVGLAEEGSIENCRFDGSISVSGPLLGCGVDVGGVAGTVSCGSVINCGSSGAITADCHPGKGDHLAAGGVVGDAGQIDGSCYVENCWNTGSLRISAQGAQISCNGIAGEVLRYVHNCWSSGDVTISIYGKEHNNSYSSSTTCYFPEGTTLCTGGSPTYPQADLTNGALVVKLNEYVAANPGRGLESWVQGPNGPELSGQTTVPAAAPAQPSGPIANPTASTVLVNGQNIAFGAYNIGGANYFKLRDLAFVLSGTEKQFSVGWDNASRTITLTSGQGYTAVGGELAAGASGNQTATPSSAKLLVDGKEVSLTAYTIGGSNYFKLRDIGQAFDFGIGWDNASKTITIDTSAGYTA